jgi:tetratricopeptide (TPR) repeat protein
MNLCSAPALPAAQDGQDASAWYDLGCAYLRAKQFREALSALEHARGIDPSYTGLRHATLQAHYWLGDYARALELGQVVVRECPKDVGAWILVVLSARFKGEWERALAWAKSAAQLNPASSGALHTLSVYEDRDRLKSANVADLTGAYVLIADKDSPPPPIVENSMSRVHELLNELEVVAYRQRSLLKTQLKLLPDFLTRVQIDTFKKLCGKTSALSDELCRLLDDCWQVMSLPEKIEIGESLEQPLKIGWEVNGLGILLIREFIDLGWLQPDALQKLLPPKVIEFLQSGRLPSEWLAQ